MADLNTPPESGEFDAENEYRRIGPPGCGKTTWLVKQATAALDAYCGRSGQSSMESTDVLITTLTKGAAAELKGRGIKIGKNQIATMHAHCYRAFNLKPKDMCLTADALKDFNSRYPDMVLSPVQERGSTLNRNDSRRGDMLRDTYDILRAKLTPLNSSKWYSNVREFAEAYEEWKRSLGLHDFGDLIHEAYYKLDHAPGDPRVIFVDEAQDHDAAELLLIRKWRKSCDKIVIVGDPDQCIYEWRGSDPKGMFSVKVPAANIDVLAQSYRVPRAVHVEAVEMIERCEDREPIAYHPRDFEGSVRDVGFKMAQPASAELLMQDARKYLDNGKSVMFLASCNYFLHSIIGELKRRGTPFWNPYAMANGGFNPLTPGGEKTSARERVKAYLVPNKKYHNGDARMWRPSEMLKWLEVCDTTSWLKRGTKKELKERIKHGDKILSEGDLMDFSKDGGATITAIEESGISSRWLSDHLKKGAKSKTTRFALRCLWSGGYKTLDRNPQVVVGTIHSVKGGESDVVYVSPELSEPGYSEYIKDPTSTYRLFYVAMTRARETLVRCDTERRGIDW